MIQDYKSVVRKIRCKLGFRNGIFVLYVLFIAEMSYCVYRLTEESRMASPNDVNALCETYANIAQTYGIVLGLVAAFTLYKMGKVSEKLNKTVNDSLKLREKYDGHAFKKGERQIIEWWGRYENKVLPFRDRKRLKHYVDLLVGNEKLRLRIRHRLECFILFHSLILMYIYIPFLFLRNTDFLKTNYVVIIVFSVIILCASVWITLWLMRSLRE